MKKSRKASVLTIKGITRAIKELNKDGDYVLNNKQDSLNSIYEFSYNPDRMKKELGIRYELFDNNGNPQCVTCGKKYKQAKDSISGKVSKYVWKPTCDCIKNKNLRLSVG